jgi:hypothetical protein
MDVPAPPAIGAGFALQIAQRSAPLHTMVADDALLAARSVLQPTKWPHVKAMAELADGKTGVVFWGPDEYGYVSLCVDDGSERHFVEASTLTEPTAEGPSARGKAMTYHERRAQRQRSTASRRGAAPWLQECWLFWVAEGMPAVLQVPGDPKKALTELILQSARDRRLGDVVLQRLEVECAPLETLSLATKARRFGCAHGDVETAQDRSPRDRIGLIVLRPNGNGMVSLRWEDGTVSHDIRACDINVSTSHPDWVAESWVSWQETEVFLIDRCGRASCNGKYVRDGEQSGRPCYTKVGSGRVTLGHAVWFDPVFKEWCLGRWNHQNNAFYRSKADTEHPPTEHWVQVKTMRVWDSQDNKCHQVEVPPNPEPVPTVTYGSDVTA